MRETERALEETRRSPSHDDRVTWPAWQEAATDAWLVRHPEDSWARRPPPGHRPTVEEIRNRAGRLAGAKDGLWPTWRLERDSPKRTVAQAQVGFLHEQLIGLYGPIHEALSAVSAGTDSAADVETLTWFLEADIYCDQSGYTTEQVIQVLKRAPLTPAFERRLRAVVLVAVDGYDRREFRFFGRLARHVDDPELRDQLEARLEDPSSRTRRHARWILEVLAQS
jgi:hypothetical protein